MNYSIIYRTEYRYSDTVYEQHDALRVKPATTQSQNMEGFRLRVVPEARFFTYVDYFGTDVVEFNIHEPHNKMTVEARSQVSAMRCPPPPDDRLEALGSPVYRELGTEFLPWERERPRNGGFNDLKEKLGTGSPLQLLLGVCDLIPSTFDYRPGVTYVGSTVEDLLRGGAGVCQDFAHLALLILRDEGIACRYVSGYLFADPEAGHDSLEVDTHAWIEALLPSPIGEPVWVGADPTNRCLVTDRHVKIGHGRYYSDIPPIKGVYRGAATSELDVHVTMTRS